MKTSDFDYFLDEKLIARRPAARRDQSRLMRVNRATDGVSHHVFADLIDLLRSDDLLVVNDTRVIPARFVCRRASGARIEGLFCREPSPGRWEVLLRNARRCKVGRELALIGDQTHVLALVERLDKGRWLVEPRPPAPAEEILRRAGHTPLPPYILRVRGEGPGDREDRRDRRRYQTVYARRPGAVAAPTAGLHFSRSLLKRLSEKGLDTVSVTLHVGPGTFAPVTSPEAAGHEMQSEWYELSASAAAAVNGARASGRRVIAVGTTSVRVLETGGRLGMPLSPCTGETDVFIYPPAEFSVVDALITNFHLPRSTLLMLVSAFCSPGSTAGVATMLSAYGEAISSGYRFYSYGDAMLIE